MTILKQTFRCNFLPDRLFTSKNWSNCCRKAKKHTFTNLRWHLIKYVCFRFLTDVANDQFVVSISKIFRRKKMFFFSLFRLTWRDEQVMVKFRRSDLRLENTSFIIEKNPQVVSKNVQLPLQTKKFTERFISFKHFPLQLTFKSR